MVTIATSLPVTGYVQLTDDELRRRRCDSGN